MMAIFAALALLGQCVLDADTPAYTVGRPAVAAMSSAGAAPTPQEQLYLSVPDAASARSNLKHITSRPHVAGTPGDLAMAEFVRDSMTKAGLDASIDPHRVLLTYPVNRSLELVDRDGNVVARAPLSEAILPTDPTSDTWWRNHTFNAYSPSGAATAPVVYANFGFPEDFDALEAAGVQVKGAIALMRYGKCFRGLKAMNAERRGAVAALIYSDPEQDGFDKGQVYPDGPWRPPTSVQRGSIQFISLCPGDPSRAYMPDGATERLCGYNQSELIPDIPTLPLSYADAAPLLRAMGGPEAPPHFRGGLNLTYRLGPTSGGARARLAIHNTFRKGPVWNVIAKVAGTLPPSRDQPVVLGNHRCVRTCMGTVRAHVHRACARAPCTVRAHVHRAPCVRAQPLTRVARVLGHHHRDAWVYGAADPNSGTAQLLEVAKGLGALLRSGWRPRRSIVLCSWSGEEYGLLGSTAWTETNAPLLDRALAYLNVGAQSRTHTQCPLSRRVCVCPPDAHRACSAPPISPPPCAAPPPARPDLTAGRHRRLRPQVYGRRHALARPRTLRGARRCRGPGEPGPLPRGAVGPRRPVHARLGLRLHRLHRPPRRAQV